MIPLLKIPLIRTKRMLVSLCIFFVTSSSYGQCPEPVIPAGDTNMVINGGFETGNISPSNVGGHTRMFSPPSAPGDFLIGSISQGFNAGMIPDVQPHSGNYMLMIDGLRQANAIAWEQDVTVQPNKSYYFSAWLTALAPDEKSEMVFQVEAGGVTSTLGAPFVPVDGPEWQQFYGLWASGSNTSATIRLINTNPEATGFIGNDYAMDDILFVPSCAGVDAGPIPDFGVDTLSTCNWGGQIDLNSGVSDFDDHTYSWFFNGASLDTNIIEPEVLSQVSEVGSYIVCLDSAGCVQSDTVEVIADLFIDLGPDVSLCSPSFLSLETGIINPDNFTINWYRDGALLPQTDSVSLLAVGSGTYAVEVIDNLTGSCDGGDEIILNTTLPEPTPVLFCPFTDPNSMTLEVTGAGIHRWWSEAEGGTELGLGNSLVVNNIEWDTVFYVEDTTWWVSNAGLEDETFLSTLTPGLNNVHDQNFLSFDALQNGIIDSLSVVFSFNSMTGGTAEVRLRNLTKGNSDELVSVAITAPGTGIQMVRIPIGLSIEAGNTYWLSVVGENGNFSTTRYASAFFEDQFPQDYELVRIVGGQAPTVMPGLIDWRISYPPTCDRVPLFVSVYCPCDDPEGLVLSYDQPTVQCEDPLFTGTLETSLSNPSAATWGYEFYRDGESLSPESLVGTSVPSGPGVYAVVVTNQEIPLCSATSESVELRVETSPVADAGEDDTTCLFAPEIMVAGSSTSGGGLWSGNGTFSPANSALEATYLPTAEELNTGSATLILTAQNGLVCEGGSDTLTLTFIEAPLAQAGDNVTICAADGEVALSGDLLGISTSTWSGSGNFLPNTTELNVVYEPSPEELARGFATVVLTPDALQGCPGVSDEVTIFIDAIPQVEAGKDLVVSDKESVQFSADTLEAGSVEWSASSADVQLVLSSPSVLNPVFTPIEADLSGELYFVLSATNGLCQGADSLKVLVYTDVDIPNAFSPNSDGINDTWNVETLSAFPNHLLSVYNRWGGLVFQSRGGYESWDGTRNGDPLPSATYYYVLELGVETGDANQELHGDVTIIR